MSDVIFQKITNKIGTVRAENIVGYRIKNASYIDVCTLYAKISLKFGFRRLLYYILNIIFDIKFFDHIILILWYYTYNVDLNILK